MTHDISRNVVAILLVLVVLVSALGTWAFMTQFESRPGLAAPASGHVQLSIAGVPAEPVQQHARVQLTIASTEGQQNG